MKRLIALQKIVELGSFTKAADKLGYTQSAVSQMIASLEEELSIKLLYRSRIGIRLTLEGEELYPFIQRTVLQYQAMQEKADEIKGLETGIIRIGTISSISCHWLPGLIKHFQELYPKVRFVLHQGDYTSIPEWVRTGEVDFGFVNPDAVYRNGNAIHQRRRTARRRSGRPQFGQSCFSHIGGTVKGTVPASRGRQPQRAIGGIPPTRLGARHHLARPRRLLDFVDDRNRPGHQHFAGTRFAQNELRGRHSTNRASRHEEDRTCHERKAFLANCLQALHCLFDEQHRFLTLIDTKKPADQH